MATLVMRASGLTAGFTLIELLLTVAIIGIAAGVLTLSLRGDEARKLREEGERLSALFRMAQSEARVGGRPLVWEADLSGYRFRGDALREELARERRWAVEVKRVETRRLLFAREPLREPAIVEIATEEHRLRLALDALGNPGPADCEDPRCVASR
ncbi:MAG: type II secretion system protein GspH [Betaproteobacteria bacterium]|nr:MAG: type II secretion system protein GspH [Betaproteobacteria bacterium]